VVLFCKKGANRSAATCAGVLMALTKRSVSDVIRYMLRLRCIVYINEPDRYSRSRRSARAALGSQRWTEVLHDQALPMDLFVAFKDV
jgi:hypothetical protein